MRILFVSGDAHLPEISGGVQSSTDQLIRLIRDQGHDCRLFCGFYGGRGWLQRRARLAIKFSRSRLSRDHVNGYPVYRTWFPWEHVDNAIDKIKPDVVLVQHKQTFQFLKSFSHRKIPCVVYLRNVEFDDVGGDLGCFSSVQFIANSQFTALAYQNKYGIRCRVIPPSIDMARYTVVPDGDKIVFINPHPLKGLDLAIEIARSCRDLPFWFVESWTLEDRVLDELREKIANLPNVELIRRTNDMRTIYGAARMVLAPSKWEEAWGRVASEAHVSGIPVVGSNRGGLPEAIGPGGLTLPYDAPLEDWVGAVRSVYSDSAMHIALSSAALRYAGREELNIDRQVDTIIEILRQAASGGGQS